AWSLAGHHRGGGRSSSRPCGRKSKGAHLERLVALEWFYVIAVPAAAGFGWTASTADRGRVFRWVSVFFALLLGFHAIARPFSGEIIECQWWFPAGRHDVYGYENEPWHWKYQGWVATLLAP